jgi:hypothetical protein
MGFPKNLAVFLPFFIIRDKRRDPSHDKKLFRIFHKNLTIFTIKFQKNWRTVKQTSLILVSIVIMYECIPIWKITFFVVLVNCIKIEK